MDKKTILRRRALPLLLLTLSSLGALGLFSAQSTIVSLILLGILALVIFHGLVFLTAVPEKTEFHPGAADLAFSFLAAGFLLFPGNMAYTPKMSRLAEQLHIPYLVNARIVAGGMGLLGFYAFYRLSVLIEKNLCRMLSLPIRREDRLPLTNLLFPLSALGFFLLESQQNMTLVVSMILAVSLCLVVSLHSPDLISWAQAKRGTRRILAAFTALGILLFRREAADLGIFGLAAGILSFPFLYICLVLFYSWLDGLWEQSGLIGQISKKEQIFYLCIFLAGILLAAVVFFQTDAFYGTPYEFDVIYTADSPKLVQENAYLALRHQENDLRQPLFAVFAAPFQGLPYLLTRFLPKARVLRPLLMDWVQIGLLLFTNFMLAVLLELDSKNRMLFMGVTSLSYPVLLFTLMMEQYIIVYFFLILCIFILIRKKDLAEMPLCSAGGTLLTSLILMPALGTAHPGRQFRSWFSQMLTIAISFLTVLLFFGRMDILLNAPSELLEMLQFSGKHMTWLQKLHQYSGFFSQCLFAPGAGVDPASLGHPSWQLQIPAGFSVSGILILVLSNFSALFKRKQPAAKAAGLWLGFSFFILFLLGWGTTENGLVLYTLYFGWAIWVLLFILLKKLTSRVTHMTVIAGILIVLILAAVNLPAIRRLLEFAFQYYPI